eukprot:TRINITY_DN23223_c0_g1_i2.p1 TRINITY_DN23223_c0_g1~~TRINITY_DN23223_c0_g1_i2.p1  ORF type:complete len:130 (+),score=19.02 TRINITY_DN23223_c0_g1_i2:2-391(+)
MTMQPLPHQLLLLLPLPFPYQKYPPLKICCRNIISSLLSKYSPNNCQERGSPQNSTSRGSKFKPPSSTPPSDLKESEKTPNYTPTRRGLISKLLVSMPARSANQPNAIALGGTLRLPKIMQRASRSRNT